MDEIGKLAGRAILDSQIRGERTIAKVRFALIAILAAFAVSIFLECAAEDGIATELKRAHYYVEALCLVLATIISILILRITSRGRYMAWMRFVPSFIDVSCVAAVHWAISSSIGLSLAFTGATAWFYTLFLVLSVFRNSAASVIFTGAYAGAAYAAINTAIYSAMGNFAQGASVYANAAGRTVKLDFDDEIIKTLVILVAAGLLAVVSRRFKQMVQDQVKAMIDREKSKAAVTDRTKSVAADIGARSNDLEEVAAGSAEGVAELTRAAERIKDEVKDELALVEQVGATVAAMLASVESTGASLSEQAAMIGEAVSSMETIFGAVRSTVGVAKDGSAAATAMLTIAEEGERTLVQASAGVARTEEAGSRISEIAVLIADVADQTNLLAMNAAIEAAHAGAAGKGFAVVAAEIRKLAETTQANAKQIGTVLKTVTEGIRTVAEGSASLGTALKSVVRNAESTAGVSKRILAAMEEEAAAADSVSETIRRLTSITEVVKAAGTSQAASASEIAGAAGRLKEQSVLINSLADDQARRAQELRAQLDKLSTVVESHARIISDLDQTVSAF
jgi:methyl-accepting chemotaxis protein